MSDWIDTLLLGGYGLATVKVGKKVMVHKKNRALHRKHGSPVFIENLSIYDFPYTAYWLV